VIETLQVAYGATPTNLSLVDLIRAKCIRSRSLTGTLTQAQQATINTLVNFVIKQSFPPELVSGLRFDLNRPFGNGVDDDGNGVVDEPTTSEYNASTRYEVPTSWNASATNPSSPFGSTVNPTYFDLNNDGIMDNNPANATSDLYARQQYAKYLYCLMM